jgi:hypothetical protein
MMTWYLIKYSDNFTFAKEPKVLHQSQKPP